LIYSTAQRNEAENDTKDTATQMKSLSLHGKSNEARETKAKLGGTRARSRASTAKQRKQRISKSNVFPSTRNFRIQLKCPVSHLPARRLRQMKQKHVPPATDYISLGFLSDRESARWKMHRPVAEQELSRNNSSAHHYHHHLGALAEYKAPWLRGRPSIYFVVCAVDEIRRDWN
jgi:hypothetical protein